MGKDKLVWLRAVTNVKVANYRWAVNALLTYDQVDGKTNEEIWRMFDAYTDKHIETVVRARSLRRPQCKRVDGSGRDIEDRARVLDFVRICMP